MEQRITAVLDAATLLLAAALALAPAAGARSDYAGQAYNVLPPGQAGSVPASGRNSSDQIGLYDGLTPLLDSVRQRDLHRYFKSERFGLGGQRPRSRERTGRRGLRILRDRFGVPHIYGRRRADVFFGLGWATTADRGTLMEVIRGPARLAALDPPGVDAFDAAQDFRSLDASSQTEAFLARQFRALRKRGRKGRRAAADVRAYLDGINAYNRAFSRPVERWTPNDVVAVAALIGGVFGRGGGDEARRSMLLSALVQKLGTGAGNQVFEDLRELQDHEAPVSVPGRFPYGGSTAQRYGNAVVDDGSFAGQPITLTARGASNALLLSARRSLNGHPLFVAGPQVGYFYPEVLLEADMHGGGIDVRGVTVPGLPYIVIGRGKDFAWSATSAGSDVVDEYVETLCGNDTTYQYKGKCRPMGTFDAGILGSGGGNPAQRISFRTTVHGPVTAYATVGGRRVAIATKRSTYGREVMSALAFLDLDSNRVRSARDFIRAASQVEFTFNWFYADSRHIAMLSSGRLPQRAPGVDPGLPTVGTGVFEWKGLRSRRHHPQAIDPHGGVILNWNNKPAHGFAAADDNWYYGSVHRVQLLQQAVARKPKHKLTSLVAAMNRAATQDLRGVVVLPQITAVLEGGPAPSPRAARMLELLKAWTAAGASRLDRDLDGKIDDPGAAILDATWQRIADAVMGPLLGPQLGQLASLQRRDDPPTRLGSAYFDGWYGYVDKDLRALLGRPVDGPFKTRFCGAGDLATCRASLWAALETAAGELAPALGPDPAAWRTDARTERIVFEPGLLGAGRTMRWTNRPTFQQAIWFRGHR